MFNFTFELDTILAISIFVPFTLFLLIRTLYPNIARDIDIVIVTFAYLYSFTLALHGWKLEPLLLASQALIIGISVFLLYELIIYRMKVDVISNKIQKSKKLFYKYLKNQENKEYYNREQYDKKN